MSTSIFGTDGVRGTPGEPPLDEMTITRLGAATVRLLETERPTLVVARDTRESGPWIERHLAAGVAAAEGTLISVGVLPTPAVAFLAGSDRFAAGFVISASHNPFPDNGIKVLTGAGEKASAALETRLSNEIRDRSWEPSVTPVEAVTSEDLTAVYEAHAHAVLGGPGPLVSSRMAVDCANGATSTVAPEVFRQLGFDVVALSADPDGRNINRGCGSTAPADLQRAVCEQGCRLGVAFDGDGDRVILVDANGEIVDGDTILYICASHRASQGQLPGDAIVATVMSNIGLEIALRRVGVAVQRCPVGDRQVFETMREQGIRLGGEQSGHIIFSDFLSTGDGLLTALSVLRVMKETGKELADLREGLEVYPQVLLNVPVRAKPPLETEPSILAAVRQAERFLGDQGRVLVRYSGTEPLLRVMIEGQDSKTVNRLAETIAHQARTRLG